MRKRYVLIPCIALVHLLVSFALLLVSAGASLGSLEAGSDLPLSSRIAQTAGNVLLYPLFTPLSGVLSKSPGWVGWLLLIANSLIWATALAYLLQIARGRRQGKEAIGPLSA